MKRLFVFTLSLFLIAGLLSFLANSPEPREQYVNVDAIYSEDVSKERMEQLAPMEEYKKKPILQDQTRNLREKLNERKILHGGVFTEGDNIVVQYTTEEDLEKIRNIIEPMGENIKYKKVEYNLAELTKLKDDITEKMMSGSLQNTVGTMINEEENKVVILLKDSESLDEELEYIDKNKVTFGEFIGAIDQAQSVQY